MAPIAERGEDLMFYTFSAHPASCAVADKVLEIMEREDLVARAKSMGELLSKRLARLEQHPNVAEVRGLGLMQAVEIVRDRDTLERFPADAHITRRIVAAGLSKGVFLYPAGSGAAQDIIMLGPPFIITEDDLALLGDRQVTSSDQTAQLHSIAYFSMEIALDASMPTYSGGLGVLAGDTLRAAADLALPVVAITLVHRKGYFRQHLDANGRQTESPSDWSPAGKLEAVEARAWVNVEGRPVELRGWRFQVRGVTGHEVPVYLLDTSLPSNDEYDQTLTDSLYGGDARYRLCQEVVLGIGGIAMLRALGHADFHTYHMNEGHSSLLTRASTTAAP